VVDLNNKLMRKTAAAMMLNVQQSRHSAFAGSSTLYLPRQCTIERSPTWLSPPEVI